MEYNEIRQKYGEFIYNGYEITEDYERIFIEFSFEIVGLSSFNPKWSFKKLAKTEFKENSVLSELAFSLGMAELVSYWKIACSPCVKIKVGALNKNQIEWWKKLYFNGLGEFFYVNNIDTDIDSFMNIICENNLQKTTKTQVSLSGTLIPIGGGKDSIVTLELLKENLTANQKANCCYMINEKASSVEAIKIAGYSSEQIIIANRSLDKNMLELNKKGFLNGHTPFSSIVAFSSVLQAYLLQKKYVALSNESSANEPTVKIGNINHQYSKSFEFEKDFNEYIKNLFVCGGSEVEYFSFLRPLSELQIADLFSHFKLYHKTFKSCNRGSKTDSWCCNCAKCLFVYIILSPFLNEDEMINIFGENLLEKESLLGIFEQLVGIQENKPFECVGSTNEACMALDMLFYKAKKQGEKIPFLLSYYKKNNQSANCIYNKKEYNEMNLLPKSFEEILKSSL